MKSSLRTALFCTSLAILPLAGCNSTTFSNEAGAEVDEGGFGNPTMMNGLAMMNEGNATIALAHRFDSEVPTTITFAFNRAELSPAAIAVLRRQADWIRQFPEVRFRVYGHTDLVGSNAYNYSLGLRRANAVVAYLASQGISTSRLEALVSYGETRPVIHTQSPEQQNRRTVTEVSGFAKGYTGLLNGKYAAIIFKEYVDSATRPHPTNTVIANQVTPK
ncbi:MAG: OmpA family protein [Paracoccaceae bacterium]